jgi:predicted GIY-YIG superfamily endonuclease
MGRSEALKKEYLIKKKTKKMKEDFLIENNSSNLKNVKQ